MDLGLKDKVAIIGGASKGLGRACAQVLAEEGAKVVICSRTASDLEQAADGIRESTGGEVLAYPADLDRLDSITGLISAALEQFGGIDVLVNNSGGPPLARSATATEEQWETAVQRSLIFFGRMCREGIPHLRQRGGGAHHQHPRQHGLQPHPQPGAVRCHPHGRGGLLQEPGRRGGTRTASWSTTSAPAPSSASGCFPM